MALTLFPQGAYVPGEYVSPEFTAPGGATTIHLSLGGRETWGSVGGEAIAVSLWLERNSDGCWRFMAGGDMRGGGYLEDGVWTTESQMVVPCYRQDTPEPYYRAILVCYAVHLLACSLMFE